MKAKKQSSKSPAKKKIFFKEELADEWDLNEEMGVLPKDISLTQNVGCVGGKHEKK